MILCMVSMAYHDKKDKVCVSAIVLHGYFVSLQLAWFVGTRLSGEMIFYVRLEDFIY